MTPRDPSLPQAQRRSIKLEPVTNITATRGYNVGKGVATTTIALRVEVQPGVADRVMDLAVEGAPMFVTLHTDQGTMFPTPAEPGPTEPEPQE